MAYLNITWDNVQNENASLWVVSVYGKMIEGLQETPPAGIVLGINETDFMGSFTMSTFR